MLIAGCAYEYTVEHLIDQWNVDCYKMDTSQWAVQQANTEIAYDHRIYQDDITSAQDINNICKPTPCGRFRTIFVECVLECLTDSEAQSATGEFYPE